MTTVAQLLKPCTPEIRALALAARAVVKKAVPGAAEKVYPGWHIIAFNRGAGMRGQFCAVSPLKERVNLYFMRGADLPDPHGLLEGGGKNMRHLKITRAAQTRSAALKALIRAAAARAEIDPARGRKNNGPVGVPPELRKAFRRSPAARAVFVKLPPSHQREYVGHITEAKQPETRARRAEKTVAALLAAPGR